MNNKQVFEQLLQLNNQIRFVKQNLDQLTEKFSIILQNHPNPDDNCQYQNLPVTEQYEQMKEIDFFCFNSKFDQSSQKSVLVIEKSFQQNKKGKYNRYPQSLKEKVIAQVKERKICPKIVAAKYQIPLKNLLRWVEFGAIRKKGGGRKIQDYTMEIKLRDWLIKMKQSRSIVTARMVKKMARSLINVKYSSTFKASKGWLEKFLKRNNISQLRMHISDVEENPQVSSMHQKSQSFLLKGELSSNFLNLSQTIFS